MGKTIIYFDGVCYFCNSLVNFLIKIDTDKRLKFSPLQSNFARTRLVNANRDFSNIDSIIVQKGNEYFIRTDALIVILKELKWYWRIFLIAKILPTKLSDKLYNFIANGRYKWFGKKEKCMIPNEGVKSRFILD